MNTLKQDLNGALNNVDRLWLRLPATLVISIAVVPVMLVLYIFQAFTECFSDFSAIFFKPCWFGIKSTPTTKG